MKNAIEVKHVDEIERDLALSRREGRFEDVLDHLDEIFVMHMHTESDAVKLRCAAILSGA
jgi:hypothetical protein